MTLNCVCSCIFNRIMSALIFKGFLYLRFKQTNERGNMSWTTQGISHLSFVSHEMGEKTHYGAENIPEINQEGHVILNGTHVAGRVFTEGNLTASDAHIDAYIRANGNATLTSTTCQAEIV